MDTTTEKRRFRRVLCDGKVTVILPDRHKTAKLLDLSLKGALIQRSAGLNLHIDQMVPLEIQLDSADQIIYMMAKTTRLEADLIGFQCEQIDLDSISILRRLVELNLDDSILLARELNSLGDAVELID